MTEGISFPNPMLPSSEAIERYLAISRDPRWFTNFGPCWQLLRKRLMEATGRPCVPVSNGTLGLIVAVAVLLTRAAQYCARIGNRKVHHSRSR